MYFDSPFTDCELTETVVLLDQTYEECRQDARCDRCPYRSAFTGRVFPEASVQVPVEVRLSPSALPRVA